MTMLVIDTPTLSVLVTGTLIPQLHAERSHKGAKGVAIRAEGTVLLQLHVNCSHKGAMVATPVTRMSAHLPCATMCRWHR